MAAFEFPQALEKRQQYGCPYGQVYRNGRCYERGAWYWWGRWVLAAVVVGITLLILILLGCMNARRRKRRGVQPFYGTGWMGGNNKHNQHQQATYAYNQQYNGQQQGYAGYPQQGADGSYPAPPPAYGQAQQNPQYTGTTFNPNDGYYGGHNEGIQLQQPQSSYQRDVYSPPAGPPPGK
ncbi:hypothetical protein ColLi_06951 [Colletotrichum liriopes]|uniref:Uncharacterized protein n=1 Tax=Colletotrichum liriopes TaxID=708192 RepID=A0AA37GPZ1_9PEZI|nr:hypothetical protein ColLi_06951 [Colletotrichum liriopes]